MTPKHPGALLRQILEDNGWTISAAADALGVSRNHMHVILREEAPISPEMAVRLELVLKEVSADRWLSRQARYDLAQIDPASLGVTP